MDSTYEDDDTDNDDEPNSADNTNLKTLTNTSTNVSSMKMQESHQAKVNDIRVSQKLFLDCSFS